MRVAALLLLLAPLALPALGATAGAQAQFVPTTVRVDIQEPNGPPLGIMIPGRPYALEVRIHYQYGQGALQPQGPTRVDLEILEAPEWMHAHLQDLTVHIPINTTSAVGGSTATGVTYVDANVTLEAPSYQVFSISVVARARANGNLMASEGTGVREFRPGFLPLLSMAPVREDVQVRGGVPTTVGVRLVNHGNGPMVVTFAVGGAPQGVRVEPPARVDLGSLATGGRFEEVVEISLSAPWTAAPAGQVDLVASFQHANRTELVGEPQTASFSLRTTSPVPGVEAAAAVGLLAVAAACRRRS
ncbi:MAG TPA: hypothetical protein VM681_03035 [Candidatus Thermoplasmatota archaeon]|nr:hypothetical protein [Candidatus Thermoplasmatota archaeon]